MSSSDRALKEQMDNAQKKLSGSLNEFKNTSPPESQGDTCNAHKGLMLFLNKMADLQESTAEGVRVVLSIQIATMEERVNKTVLAMGISAVCAAATVGFFILELIQAFNG